MEYVHDVTTLSLLSKIALLLFAVGVPIHLRFSTGRFGLACGVVFGILFTMITTFIDSRDFAESMNKHRFGFPHFILEQNVADSPSLVANDWIFHWDFAAGNVLFWTMIFWAVSSVFIYYQRSSDV